MSRALVLDDIAKPIATATDEELARCAATGDRAAFDEIVHRYGRMLTNFAAARSPNMQDAEDVVQETFLRAYVNLASFDSRYALRNWLFTIAYRLIVSGYRKKKPQHLTDGVAAQLTTPPFEEEAEHGWLWEAAREMGDDAFTALWLRYKQGMKTAEIAIVMKKSKINVRVLLHRSRTRLAQILKKRPELAEHPQWMRDESVLLEGT